MAKWLEHVVVAGGLWLASRSVRPQNLFDGRKPSDYVSFRKTVKIKWFHTLKTHDIMPRTTQQQFTTDILQVAAESQSILNRWRSFPPD